MENEIKAGDVVSFEVDGAVGRGQVIDVMRHLAQVRRDDGQLIWMPATCLARVICEQSAQEPDEPSVADAAEAPAHHECATAPEPGAHVPEQDTIHLQPAHASICVDPSGVSWTDGTVRTLPGPVEVACCDNAEDPDPPVQQGPDRVDLSWTQCYARMGSGMVRILAVDCHTGQFVVTGGPLGSSSVMASREELL